MTTAFSIFTMMPRTRISENCVISDITGVSTGLVVEEDEASPDPLNFLCEATSTESEVLYFKLIWNTTFLLFTSHLERRKFTST